MGSLWCGQPRWAKENPKICHNSYMAAVTFVYLVFETWTLGNKPKYFFAFHVTFPFKRQKDSQELSIQGTDSLSGQYTF